MGLKEIAKISTLVETTDYGHPMKAKIKDI